MSERLSSRQWGIVLLIAAVQFVNVLDFVMVMPLGPDLARALGISPSELGYVNGSYTAAAAVSGVLGSFFLDRFDRRKALGVALLGLVTGTAAGGFATSLPTLLLARMIAGAFGGPATSLSFSIISDTIPQQLRGRAMGTVMAAFSVASVLGVPTGLFLAEAYDWRAPFFAVAGMGVVVVIGAIAALPPMTAHLERKSEGHVSTADLLGRPLVQLSYLTTATVMMAGFVLIPNIASYLQFNLGLPRELLKYCYLAGGVSSFFATQLGGRLVDRFGSFKVGAFGASLVICVVFTGFYWPWSYAPPAMAYLLFVCFMLANGVRNVSYNTLASKVPEPAVRARFQSFQSAVQHGASAFAAVLSAQLLTMGPRAPQPGDAPGRAATMLVGMNHVALMCMSLSALIPLLLFVVERRVKARVAAGLPA
jgi:predicted MFS family arabinose efflux permease